VELTIFVGAKIVIHLGRCAKITELIKSTLSCLLAPLFAILIGGMASAAQDDAKTVRDDASVQVAKAWFISLMQGDTAVTASLSEHNLKDRFER